MQRALQDCSTLLFLALRFSLAAVALAAAFRGGQFRGTGHARRDVLGGVLAGFFLFVSYFLQTLGLRYTTASKSAFLTGLNLVFVPLLASLWSRRAPTLSEWSGVGLATAGMALITLNGQQSGMNRGDVMTVGCAVTFSVHILLVSHYVQRGSYRNLSLLQMATAAAFAWGNCWWAEPAHVRWTAQLVFALGVTALLATALAFTVMTWAQCHTTPTRSTLIFSLEPAVAALMGYWVTGEALSAMAMTGAILILSGILLAELKPFR